MVYEKAIGKTNYMITSQIPEEVEEDIVDCLLRLIRRDLENETVDIAF